MGLMLLVVDGLGWWSKRMRERTQACVRACVEKLWPVHSRFTDLSLSSHSLSYLLGRGRRRGGAQDLPCLGKLVLDVGLEALLVELDRAQDLRFA